MIAVDPATLVVLVGASGAGKSTWAADQFRATEIVSSDHLRSIVGTGPHDLDASSDAFATLDLVSDGRVDLDALLQEADVAVYRAKASG